MVDIQKVAELAELLHAALAGCCASINSSAKYGESVNLYCPVGIALARERGVVPGRWYAWDGRNGPQRNYEWEAGGVPFTAIETAEEAGLTPEQCLQANIQANTEAPCSTGS